MRYDNVFGVMDDLFPAEEKETKKESPSKKEPNKKLQLHYTQAAKKGQEGLYLVGRTAHAPAHRMRGGSPC